MYRAVTSQNQKLIKFLKLFAFDGANYSLMKKVFFIF